MDPTTSKNQQESSCNGASAPVNSEPSPRAAEVTANPALRVVIVAADFPATRLSANFCEDLQERLSCAIDALPRGGAIPRFNEYCLTVHGIVRVSCCNEDSKEWLTTEVKRMSPVQWTSLLVLEEEALPRFPKIVAFVPGFPINRDNFLRRLEISTPELCTGHWKIDDIVEVPDEGSRIIIDADEASIETLRQLNFVGFAGMRKISFWDSSSEQGDSEANESSEAFTSDEEEAWAGS